MDRRMAALFLLALVLIVWQALSTEPAGQPAFEVATKAGERLSPVAVPSWRPPLQLPGEIPERLALLEERSLSWPGAGETAGEPGCRVFLRVSSQHWAFRPASETRLQRWLGREAREPGKPWQLLHLPVESFLDDDDGDGDPLDDGELLETGPGAEVEAFCGEAARTSGGRL
jgi:hypothetical protein